LQEEFSQKIKVFRGFSWVSAGYDAKSGFHNPASKISKTQDIVVADLFPGAGRRDFDAGQMPLETIW